MQYDNLSKKRKNQARDNIAVNHNKKLFFLTRKFNALKLAYLGKFRIFVLVGFY